MEIEVQTDSVDTFDIIHRRCCRVDNNGAGEIERRDDRNCRKWKCEHAHVAIFWIKEEITIINCVFNETVNPTCSLSVEFLHGPRYDGVHECIVAICDDIVMRLNAKGDFHVFGIMCMAK